MTYILKIHGEEIEMEDVKCGVCKTVSKISVGCPRKECSVICEEAARGDIKQGEYYRYGLFNPKHENMIDGLLASLRVNT